MLAVLLQLAAPPDSVRLEPVVSPILFDGAVSRAEYGKPSLVITRPGGNVVVWLRRQSPWVYLAADLPDSSYYWGDDLVISLDTGGDRAPAPMHDDFQWYFRRMLDSSVIFRGDNGKWRAPRDDPDWHLGASREGPGWEVRGTSRAGGWSIEFRLDSAYFTEAKSGAPGLAIRSYNDAPQRWDAWPSTATVRQPTEVERRPDL